MKMIEVETRDESMASQKPVEGDKIIYRKIMVTPLAVQEIIITDDVFSSKTGDKVEEFPAIINGRYVAVKGTPEELIAKFEEATK